MPQTKAKFYLEAELEVESAFEWYFERSPYAAHAFLQELDYAISCVSEAPEKWPKYGMRCRRYIFSRFPFHLIYQFFDNTIQVVAVAHSKRKPNYWQERVLK